MEIISEVLEFAISPFDNSSEWNFQGTGELEGKKVEVEDKEENGRDLEGGEWAPFSFLVCSWPFLSSVSALEGKCPVRPRSLNCGQRSRVIRFRRQVRSLPSYVFLKSCRWRPFAESQKIHPKCWVMANDTFWSTTFQNVKSQEHNVYDTTSTMMICVPRLLVIEGAKVLKLQTQSRRKWY